MVSAAGVKKASKTGVILLILLKYMGVYVHMYTCVHTDIHTHRF